MTSIAKIAGRTAAGRLAAVLAITAAAAACGGGAAAPAPTAPAPTVAAPDQGSELPADVQAAADAAAAKGMLFVASREEIIANAEAVGELNILISVNSFQQIQDAFSAAYPNLEVYIEEFTGTETYQRFSLEAAAGAIQGWDVAYNPPEYYDEFTQLLAPYDIFGMAEVGILDIPLGMIDPDRRNTVAVSSQLAALAYNRDLIAPEDVPRQWEDLLDPKWSGNFMLDIRPSNLAPMVPLWGEERTLEYARGLAANSPIWSRGQTAQLNDINIGEYAMLAFANYHSGVRAQERDPSGKLEMVLLEPVPVRIGEVLGVFGPDIASNPWAALLFIEWMAGAEGQMFLDADPLKSSIFADTGRIGNLVRELEVSVVDFNHFSRMDRYMGDIVEAFGFPTVP